MRNKKIRLPKRTVSCMILPDHDIEVSFDYKKLSVFFFSPNLSTQSHLCVTCKLLHQLTTIVTPLTFYTVGLV